MKVCSKEDCVHNGEPQNESNFSKRSDRNCLRPECKDCERKQKKQYYKENREGILAKKKIYHRNNQEKMAHKSKIYREKNKDKLNKNRREYYIEHKEELRIYQREYRKTNKAKENEKLYKAKENEKVKCRDKLRLAVRRGKIIKPTSCSICGKTDCIIDGHHKDYNKPLKVIWCCRFCHKKLDK